MRAGKSYMTKEQMRKSDYYILKTSSPMEHDSGGDGETSSSLLDLDNNEFNFTSIKVQSPRDINTVIANGTQEVDHTNINTNLNKQAAMTAKRVADNAALPQRSSPYLTICSPMAV